MVGENLDTESDSKEVTVVVNIMIKPGFEKDYDKWLEHFLILQRKVPGHLGTVTIMETGPDSSTSCQLKQRMHVFKRYSVSKMLLRIIKRPG